MATLLGANLIIADEPALRAEPSVELLLGRNGRARCESVVRPA